MFSLISNIVNYFIGDSDSGVDETTKSVPACDHQDVFEDHTLSDAPFLVRQSNAANRKAVDGRVTHIFHGHGLIEGYIYFSSENVARKELLQIGDGVHTIAVQYGSDGGWHAEQVHLTDRDWDAAEEEEKANKEIDLRELQKGVVLGKVTSFKRGRGLIENNIEFMVEDCIDGYSPRQGDWVSASVEEVQEEKDNTDKGGDWDDTQVITYKRATSVGPSREMELDGTITAVMKDHGYINGEIFFTPDSCLNGYNPRKQDVVHLWAVESTHGTCEWRAVKIVPLSSEASAYRSKQFRQPSRRQGQQWVVPGQRPMNFQKKVILPVKLPQFLVPDSLDACVRDRVELTDSMPYLAQEMCFRNYVSRMSTLLYLEEIQLQMDIREFDLNRVCLQHVGQFLSLTVPGLAEGRPSILIGDKVLLSSPSDPDGPIYEGFVHETTCTAVHLKFTTEFHSRYSGEDFNVVFTFNRTPLRRCHMAISMAVQYFGSQVLFPGQVKVCPAQIKEDTLSAFYSLCGDKSAVNNMATNSETNEVGHTSHVENHQITAKQQPAAKRPIDRYKWTSPNPDSIKPPVDNYKWTPPNLGSKKPSPMKNICFYNSKLNQRQRTAVVNILAGRGRPTPYVIFGPPGTGKTMTVVEAVLQVLTRIPHSRVLACTPSNSAADLIAERLYMSGLIKQTELVRLNAFQRSLEAIPECILPVCKFAEDLKMIARHRVIVSTCSMAGSLLGLGLSAGHVTHVFVDEAGQATEPESLVPISLLCGGDGQVILAGDPKQLGPIVMSPFAKMYGLELSLLERLMSRRLYQRDENTFAEHGGFDPLLVTMLVNNYRSHPSILELPSRLFYYNQLLPLGPASITNTLMSASFLPTSGLPVVFHGARGEDVRETDSPSWFNPSETLLVVQYLQLLLKEGTKPEDIGIITPYRKQVEKIRMMIERLNMPDVKVGSVEEFQGQERQAIIISTVRSNEKLVGFDVRHSLGFLSSPKRFNVSITRAQALLVIIGNPHVLKQDVNWRELLRCCKDSGTYTGCDMPDLSDEDSEEFVPVVGDVDCRKTGTMDSGDCKPTTDRCNT